jgi:hypothetical protein
MPSSKIHLLQNMLDVAAYFAAQRPRATAFTPDPARSNW